MNKLQELLIEISHLNFNLDRCYKEVGQLVSKDPKFNEKKPIVINNNPEKLQKTFNGFIWAYADGHWKDLSTGLKWCDKAQEQKYTYNDAIEKYSYNLPTIEEYKLAEKHGIREVLSDMKNSFWSSSPYPTYPYFAYYFYGGNGNTNYDFRNLTLSVRCVGR